MLRAVMHQPVMPLHVMHPLVIPQPVMRQPVMHRHKFQRDTLFRRGGSRGLPFVNQRTPRPACFIFRGPNNYPRLGFE
jgi:hypothetical protein